MLNTSEFCNSQTLKLLGEAVSTNTLEDIKNSAATEKAMLKFITRCGFDYKALRNHHLGDVYTRFQFDSSRKRMSTVLNQTDSGKKRVHIKGASEIVLETCTHFLDNNGMPQLITDQMKTQLNDTIQKYAQNALRTIAFAYKDLDPGFGGEDHKDLLPGSKVGVIEESDNILIAIAGIMDIIRPEVPEAVSKCNFAGVRVRMVTGDNKVTAIAIAKECGILS